MTHARQRALDHLRVACREITTLSKGCRIYQEDGLTKGYGTITKVYNHDNERDTYHVEWDSGHETRSPRYNWTIIGHTPQLHHFLAALYTTTGGPRTLTDDNYVQMSENDSVATCKLIERYNLARDGDNQEEEFYQMYNIYTACTNT